MNTLLLEAHNGVLHITLNRPECRNAMSLAMVKELRAVLAQLDSQVRAVVISGAGGHFCAGADVKDLVGAGAQLQGLNRAFGTLLQEIEALPQAVIVLVQGAVLGGGFGLVCVSDIAIADHQAQFGLPETRLGLLPAQIAPFVVKRIGLTQARRLALTAARFDGVEAERLGVVHFVELDAQALAQRLDEVLGQVLQCAPAANARTKSLLLASVDEPLGAVLDRGAQWFAEAVASEEGIEGTQAFVHKRKPRWAR
ncbi:MULTISPECIES: enoyl-CoA hydratase/isomerase family protein [Pseudomonas]|uniref:FadB_4 protein n=1 Tax=Pseudomonas fluorescens TaxID=294 RepID=A0A0D0T7N4_PSEFL|nr:MULTISPECIES: enoyl-CoA hydratase-related protein [Pseudomonas]AZE62394.1 Isohexenylglutaconyl-CoA hydratase [Pseudomonas synxantha]KIR19676.1 putative enoyl-CoA hydratase [Pseudomonas fluorescens]MBV4480823.1 enoyl-CoA hydratase/isomerase family protein [Pseudomonas khavaziana]